MYKNLFNKIKSGERVCIYGTDLMAVDIYKQLKMLRPDVEVKFFINSFNDGIIDSVPIYKASDIDNYISSVDIGIVTSLSSRYYMETILRGYGIKNIISIDKLFYEKYQKSYISKPCNAFQNSKDRKLYEFIAKARRNKSVYLPKIKEYYDKTYPERINMYPMKQYFEFIKPEYIKTCIDGGGFNGIHSVLFTQNFPNCEQVYMFEPAYESFKDINFDKIIKNDSKIKIINKGLWNIKTQLEFREEINCKHGSSIVEVKPNIKRPQKIIKIETANIDGFALENNLKIDFIKMDIENAEMKALEGAKNVLLTQRPQLAISIYHSDEQFYEIPCFLNELLDNYEFHIRHYSDRLVETVLYAIPKELK